MNIIYGLQTGMVMQRNQKDECDITFHIKANGKLHTDLGNLTQKEENFYHLGGIPVGGPYTLTLTDDADERKISSLYVGDVWLLGGQSNMAGMGSSIEAAGYETREDVRALMFDNSWQAAVPSLHPFWKSGYSFLRKKALANNIGDVVPEEFLVRSVGPGYYFGMEMKKYTGIPQGLIPCAVSSSSLEQWDPDLEALEGDSLFGIAIDRFRRAGGHIRGIFWYQGCAEAEPGAPELFCERMDRLIKAFRDRCGDVSLPFVQVQICRYCVPNDSETDRRWSLIREFQRRMPERIPNLDTVAVTTASMTDIIHLSTSAHKELGRQAAESMYYLCFGQGEGFLPAPALGEIFVDTSYKGYGGSLGVRYRNLHGVLTASGNPTGFQLLDEDSDKTVRNIFQIDLEGDTLYIRHAFSEEQISAMKLSYFYVSDPYANITDSARRPLPAFGPIALRDVLL